MCDKCFKEDVWLIKCLLDWVKYFEIWYFCFKLLEKICFEKINIVLKRLLIFSFFYKFFSKYVKMMLKMYFFYLVFLYLDKIFDLKVLVDIGLVDI